MNLPLTGKINKKGHLEIGGCDTLDLAKKFGTPLYVIDETDVRSRCRDYKQAFASYKNVEIAYASKALSSIGLIKVIKEEGLGVDVMSGGELYTALMAGINPKKIYFHGNLKSTKEITEGINAGIGHFVVDSIEEIVSIAGVAKKFKKKATILIRVNPGVEAHTFDAVKTGTTDSKFGVSKENILKAVKKAIISKYINFTGLHAHIGSQIFDGKGFCAEIEVLVKIAKDIKDEFGFEISELNLGGGIGISYTQEDSPKGVEAIAKEVLKCLNMNLSKYGIKAPKLILEPGRSIIATAGITLYSVGLLKDIPGIRKYVIIDGGMSDNIRPMLYGAKYEFVLAKNMSAKAEEKVTIAGKHCESGDVLRKDVLFPTVKAGDIIAVLCTGAYNYSMASNYNRVTRPAIVMVRGGKAKLIVRRETYKDITACDVK